MRRTGRFFGQGRRWLALAVVAVVLALGAGWGLAQRDGSLPEARRQPLGLFTSLPLLWGEAPGVAELLATPPPPHWAKALLERRYRLIALDTLHPPANMALLLVAQPRAFSPDENVALDRFVRRGGRVLLFADPLLTWDSAFTIGDRRRPQGTVLLSPILKRWGLDLRFDESQPSGVREIAGIPVNLPGTLALSPEQPAPTLATTCRIEAEGLLAKCRIGRGYALIVADAAVLEPDGQTRQIDALNDLVRQAFTPD